ncbi:MAG: hypothetical protein IPL75_01095 [Acidobacteria bacterium]|nr:hypothetical protein [Acidobacteriota bacterium]
MVSRTSRLLFALLLVPAAAGTASAQGLLFDARSVAMGGGGGNSSNIALKMVPPSTRAEVVIPIPLGLIQVFQGGLDKFKPNSDSFDPVLAAETLGNPMQYRFGADTSGPRYNLINDIVNGTVNPNLAVYAGFDIPETFADQGLLSPQFGLTLKFAKKDDRFHGLYVGVGPYLSFDTSGVVDPRLADIFAEGTSYPNATMSIDDSSQVQLAMAVTAGYRGRLALGSGGSSGGAGASRDGVYVAYNFHVLRGFRYLEPDINIRFNTNAAGILTPSNTPVTVLSLQGHEGSGIAQDVGVQIVRGRFQGGVGINGIGNRINWSDFTFSTHTLASLTAGLDFIETPGVTIVTDRRVTLPVVKSANIGYEGDGWGATATVADGYNGKSFAGGAERKVGPFWVRGGARYSRSKWEPSAGFGIGTNVALDIAVFGTHANLQSERQMAVAASVRIGRN